MAGAFLRNGALDDRNNHRKTPVLGWGDSRPNAIPVRCSMIYRFGVCPTYAIGNSVLFEGRIWFIAERGALDNALIIVNSRQTVVTISVPTTNPPCSIHYAP